MIGAWSDGCACVGCLLLYCFVDAQLVVVVQDALAKHS